MTAPDEIRAPRSDRPRYCPGRKFPSYRFVPGLHPHPVRDPDGHSAGDQTEPGAFAGWDSADWADLSPWLRGVDLFNHFYFWEAHEAWETLWRDAVPGSASKLFLQGLIQLAAALLKTHLGSVDGARKLSSAGIEKLNSVSERHPVLMGLDVLETATKMRTYFSPLAHGELPILNDGVPTLHLSANGAPGARRC